MKRAELSFHRPPKVLVDACVLYQPIPTFVISRLHDAELCLLLYSDMIRDEYYNHREANKGEDSANELEEYILGVLGPPSIHVKGKESEYGWLRLSDPDDKPVLFAAGKGKVDYLLTENTQDFPSHEVHHPKNKEITGLPRSFSALSLDDFLCAIYDLDSDKFLVAVARAVRDAGKPSAKYVAWALRDQQRCKRFHKKIAPHVKTIDDILTGL